MGTTLLRVKRQGGRAELTLSDGETLFMPRAMLKERPYRGGVPFDRDAFDAFLRERAYSFALEKAVALLAVRPRSAQEIRAALLARAYPPQTVERVLERLDASGCVDDADFASNWTASRVNRGLGPRRVQMELRRKGIDPETIECAMSHLDEDAQLEAAMLAARKAARGRNLALYPERQRVFGALARRGFGASVAKQAIQRLLEE